MQAKYAKSRLILCTCSITNIANYEDTLLNRMIDMSDSEKVNEFREFEQTRNCYLQLVAVRHSSSDEVQDHLAF